MATLNPAQSFLLDLHAQAQSDVELAKAYETIPEMFIQQARDGYSMPFINAEHVTNIRYSNTPNSDFFRVVIQDCMNEANGISFKIALQGIHDAKRNMIATDRNKSKPDASKGEAYVRNFSSQRILLTQADIDAGILSQEDFERLKDYTNWWESITQEHGSNAQYSVGLGFSEKRHYLVARNEAFFLGFQLEVRTNHDPGVDMPNTIGICQLLWSNIFVDDKPDVGHAEVGTVGFPSAKKAVVIKDRSFHSPVTVVKEITAYPAASSNISIKSFKVRKENLASTNANNSVDY